MSAKQRPNGDRADGAWFPLLLTRGLVNSTRQIDRNISTTLESKYSDFIPLLNSQSGAVSIVGSGPSLERTWQDLNGDVMACNSAGKFLLDKGVVPKWWMMFDADPLLTHCITPHPDVTYLVASRCHRQIFDILKDCKVIVWHAKGDKHIDDLLYKHGRMEPMIAGGSTAVTRCMFMVQTMGYRTIHLFGADSSYEEDGKTHFEASADDHQQKPMTVMVGPVNAKEFQTTTWLAGQSEDFKILSESLRRLGVRIVVHGTGLIPHLAKEMGFDVDGQSKLYQAGRSIAQKARILWQYV